MKYNELPPEKAREICKKYAIKRNGITVTDCDKCPLRRERKDEKEKIHTLVCFYRIQELLIGIEEEYEECGNEEIKYL